MNDVAWFATLSHATAPPIAGSALGPAPVDAVTVAVAVKIGVVSASEVTVRLPPIASFAPSSTSAAALFSMSTSTTAAPIFRLPPPPLDVGSTLWPLAFCERCRDESRLSMVEPTPLRCSFGGAAESICANARVSFLMSRERASTTTSPVVVTKPATVEAAADW